MDAGHQRQPPSGGSLLAGSLLPRVMHALYSAGARPRRLSLRRSTGGGGGVAAASLAATTARRYKIDDALEEVVPSSGRRRRKKVKRLTLRSPPANS